MISYKKFLQRQKKLFEQTTLFQIRDETFTSMLLVGLLILLYSIILINYVHYQDYINKKSESSSPRFPEPPAKLAQENSTKNDTKKFQRKSILLWTKWWNSDFWWISDLVLPEDYFKRIGEYP
jgi:hypothetical protein